MSNGDAEQTTIQVTQQFGTVQTGGRGVGVYFEQHKGDIYFASPDAKPPRREMVLAYLNKAKEFPPPPKGLEKFEELPYEAHRPGESRQERHDLYELVRDIFAQDRKLERIERVVVLAEGGAGKTPALYYLRKKAAERSMAKNEEYLAGEGEDDSPPDSLILPLFVDLASLNAGLSLYALVRDAFNARIEAVTGMEKLCLEQVPLLLGQYRCQFLLDGLDEVISARHEAGLYLIQHFMEQNPRCQYVITSRTSSYREQLGAIDTVYLSDLREKDAIAVLGEENYHRLNNSLQQLARNRGMLEAILTMDEKAVPLQNKGQLLHRLSQRDLDKPESETALSTEVAQGLLEHLAFHMHRAHALFLEEDKLMEQISGYLEQWNEPHHWRQAANSLRDDYQQLKRDDRERHWKFDGRTTQAFFTAMAILAEPTRLAPVLMEVSDYWWREMFEILVGLVPEPTTLFFELVDRDALVAANSLQYVGRELDNRVTEAVIDALVERMGREGSARRKFIVERIGESPHPRAPEALFLALHREDSSMVVRAIARALWSRARRNSETDKEIADKIKALAQVEEEVLHGWPRSSRPVSGVLSDYSRTLAEDEEERVAGRDRLIARMSDPEGPALRRGLAAVYVGQFTAENDCEDESRQALLELFVDPGVNDFVAWCATEALTTCVHKDVEARAIALYEEEAYRKPEWRRHRARAIYLLGWVTGNAETGMLVRQGLHDKNAFVRGYAVESMARLDLPDARTLIEKRMDPEGADPETDADVLRKMAEALAQIGTMASVPVLQRYLRHERTRTRHMMRKAIAEIRQRYSM